MVLDELQRFYACPEKELLELPIKRFWNKEKNMRILKLRERINVISNTLVSFSSNVLREMAKLRWEMKQLTGEEKVEDLADVKKRQRPVKTKDLDDIKRMVMDQRRRAKKLAKRGKK